MKINWKEVAVFCGAIFLPMIIIRILFVIPAPCEFFDPEWKEGDVLTYISTMVLSWIAVYQNKKVNDINDRMLTLEERKNTPGIALFNLKNTESEDISLCEPLFSTLGEDGQYIHFSVDGGIDTNCESVFMFKIKNVSDSDIIELSPLSVKVCYLDSEENEIQNRKYDQIFSNASDHAMQTKQIKAFFFGSKNFWFELVEKKGDKLKLIFDFYLQGSDGVVYFQQIDVFMVNAITNGCLSPIILKQKIHKPERKGDREWKS